jgi:hypothetical protein
MAPFTIVDAERAVRCRPAWPRAVLLDPAALRTRWAGRSTTDSLCNDAMCIPLADEARWSRRRDRLDRPLPARSTGRWRSTPRKAPRSWAPPPASASQALAAQHAPDFSLPDLDGRLHTLREHRGKKILLVAWASW